MSVVGIVPAGGSGERLGADRPKAFVVCAGRPLVDWSIEVLASVCERVVVAVPPGYEEGPDRVTGGPSRSASVRNATGRRSRGHRGRGARCRPAPGDSRARTTLPDRSRRPGGRDRRSAGHRHDPYGGPGGRDRVHPPRSALWAAQTPQVFRADILRRALATDDATLAAATDDAALVVAAGGRVRVVESPTDNVKVTTENDLRVVESALC